MCLPGARISDVASRVKSMCTSRDSVVVGIGTNDVPRGSLGSIQSSFKDLLFELKDIGCRVLVLGLLPRRGSDVMVGKMLALNRWLHSMCFLFGFEFAEFWDKFSLRPDWYLADGLHLTKTGASVLARCVNGLIRSLN